MTGTPQIVTALTTASPDDGLAVKDVRPKQVNVGELFRRSLLHFELPVAALWVPSLLRFFVSTDATDSAALLAAWSADQGGQCVLRPRAGQTSRNMLWEVVSNTLDVVLEGLLANDYQKRTAWGLLQAGMSHYETTAYWTTAAMLDQVNGVVGLAHMTGEAATALATFTPAGQTVCLEMEQHSVIVPIFE